MATWSSDTSLSGPRRCPVGASLLLYFLSSGGQSIYYIFYLVGASLFLYFLSVGCKSIDYTLVLVGASLYLYLFYAPRKNFGEAYSRRLIRPSVRQSVRPSLSPSVRRYVPFVSGP